MAIEKCYIVPHPPIILPEIGKGMEKKLFNTTNAYEEISKEICSIKPATIIIASPHSVTYADYIHISPGEKASGSFKDFRAPEVKIEKEYDMALIQAICQQALENQLPAGTMGEKTPSLDHGTMIPLYFIDKYYQDYKLIRCSLSGLSPSLHYLFGKCIQAACDQTGTRAVFIASGDLSHCLSADSPYGFAKEGEVFDNKVTEAIATGDFMQFMTFSHSFTDKAGECGLRAFQILAGVLDQKELKSNLFSYEAPFGVGYAAASFTVTGINTLRQFDKEFLLWKQKQWEKRIDMEDEYVQLARLSLETVVLSGQKLKCPPNLLKELTENQAGVFVSLKKDGMLRGCIGTIEAATSCIADEIINNAVSAGLHDPRFSPVEADELPDLVYSVDVLKEPEPITSIRELDVKKYGIIVTAGQQRGLLLPNIDGVDSPEQQVSIALQKGGIQPDEPYEMERFEVVRH